MINYYDILNVPDFSDKETIAAAYYATEKREQNPHDDEDINEAFEVLMDDDKKGEYDAKLIKYQEKVEKTKKVINKIKIPGLIVFSSIVLVLAGTKVSSCAKKSDDKTVTLTSTPTPKLAQNVTLTPTPKLTQNVTPTSAVTQDTTNSELNQNVVTPMATPTAAVEEENIFAKDINAKAEEIDRVSFEKGFNQKCLPALIYANGEYFGQDAVKFIENDENSIELYKAANAYICDLAFHNYIAMGDESKYIKTSDLVYNETDKEILAKLDQLYIDYTTALKNGKLTKSQYNDTYKYFSSFSCRLTKANEKDEISEYDKLSMGGKMLFELAIGNEMYLALTESKYCTDEIMESLNVIQTDINDGLRYNGIIIYQEKTECLTKTK